MDALPSTLHRVLVVVDILVLIIGVVCNGSILLIIFTRQVNSSPRNYLLANIAIGDLFLLLTSDLLNILLTFGVVDVSEEIVCFGTAAAIVVSQGVAVLTLMAISVDRFLAIVHPFAILRLRPGKMYGTVVVIIWIISMVVAAPIFFIGESGILNDTNTSELYPFCDYVPTTTASGAAYDITRGAVFYAIPLIVICISYILVAQRIFKSTEFAKTSSNSCERVQSERQKLGILVLAIAVLFAVCWAPTTFFSIFKHFQFNNLEFMAYIYYTVQLQVWCATMVYINGCTNPIILYLMSKSYREGLMKLVCLKEKSSSKLTSMNTSTRMMSSVVRNKTKFIRINDESHEMSQMGGKRDV